LNIRNGVGRNKTFRAQARISVSGIRYEECAGNATTRSAWVVLFRPVYCLLSLKFPKSTIKNLKIEYKLLSLGLYNKIITAILR